MESVKQEAEREEEEWIAQELYEFGAVAATVVCASLWGPKVLQMDLVGTCENIGMGKDGTKPAKPTIVVVNLLFAPYVFMAMMRESRVKQELDSI